MRILSIYNLNQIAESYREDLIHRGHSVDIFEPSLIGASAPLPVKLAMMPKRLFNLRHVLGDLHPGRYDLVHIHWASYGALGLVGQIPYIVECHGSDVRYRLQHPIHRSILKTIFRHAAGVHCITPDILPLVQSIRSDALFFPGPVDTDRFAPLEETGEDGSVHPWSILVFMRLDPIKGAEVAVEGVARFAEHHPEVRVQVLDWGKLKEPFKQKYSKRFEFLPRIPSTEVQHMLHGANVVVGQCKVGSLGLCELQAMSCAKPVIASFFYPEAYPAPPPLCQATTPEEIQEHLETLFQDRASAQELGKRARSWAICNHSRQNLSAKLEARYLSILAKHPLHQVDYESANF